MNRFKFHLKIAFSHLGQQGVLGLMLLFAAVGSYFVWIAPAKEQMLQLSQQIQALRQQPKFSLPLNTQDVYSNFWVSFPSQQQSASQIREVQQIAVENKIKLERIDYKYTKINGTPLWRYQMSFPVVANYAVIRHFISVVLTKFPNAALQGIEVDRQDATEEVVESKVNLVFYYQGIH